MNRSKPLSQEQPSVSAVRETLLAGRAAFGEHAGHLGLFIPGGGQNKTMVCVACRERHHEDCPGGTWCDCQHLPARDAAPAAAEPTLSWVRQG